MFLGKQADPFHEQNDDLLLHDGCNTSALQSGSSGFLVHVSGNDDDDIIH